MAWTTLTLETTTPLFNAGGDMGEHATGTGIRPASIRGAMRFWFRALAGCMTGPDISLLAALERRVFGSASGQDKAAASPVLLRIPRQPPVVPASGPHSFLPDPALPVRERRQDSSRWLLYLMGQGLADMAGVQIRRPYVGPGNEFPLMIAFRHRAGDKPEERAAIEALAFASLWLTCAYGGVGARARRGFGGLRITRAEGALPAPWLENGALLTPRLDYFERLRVLWPDGPLAACMPLFWALAPKDRLRGWAKGTTPDYPALSRTHTSAATSGGGVFTDWAGVLMHAGEQFRRFRASRDNTRPTAHYEPKIETPEWVEVVNGASTSFRLGALGLPVNFKSGSDEYTVNAESSERSEPLRRASPLWLRAVGEGDEWRLLSFAFHTRFLPGPDAPTIHLRDVSRHGNRHVKQLDIADEDVPQVTGQWISALRADQSFAGQRRRE